MKPDEETRPETFIIQEPRSAGGMPERRIQDGIYPIIFPLLSAVGV